MPINSPRRGELNGLRVKFNRRCFFQPSPRRDSPKISLAYVSRVYEKTSLRGRTRGKSDLPFLVNRIAYISSDITAYLSSPHYISRPSPSIHAREFFLAFARSSILSTIDVGAKAGQDGNGRKCIASADELPREFAFECNQR